MTAPRLDLAELRRLHEEWWLDGTEERCSIADRYIYPALPALLSIAEAAEAWLERGSTLETHAALRAALAAVRKEEKGE